MSHFTYDKSGSMEYPRTGFWAIHAIGIAAVLYLGYKLGQNDEECYEYD